MYDEFIIPFYKPLDRIITRAKDCYLFDSEGQRYIDFESGVWCSNLGHCNEEINYIIDNQIKEIIHHGYKFTNKQSEELSEKLLNILNFEEGKSVFLSSGSEAVNLSISVAKKITNREKVLTINNSYLSAFGHGQNSTDNEKLLKIENNDYGSLININFEEIAAFVLEPGTSSGLMEFYSNDFVMAIEKEAKSNDCLLVIDEVTTGFGRTGRFFGFEYYKISPDIVVTGKALGNGYPISAVSVSSCISNELERNIFRYLQSHQNDPLGCSIGLEVIRVLTESDLIKRSNETGDYFKELLFKTRDKHQDVIKDIRARGMMLALEFNKNVDVVEINNQLFDNGFVVGNKEQVLRFMPPLTMKREDIDKLIDTLETIIKKGIDK